MKKLALALFTVCLFTSVGCDSFKKQELSKEKLLDLAEKCNKSGKEYFKDYSFGVERNHMPTEPNFLWDEPEFHYNSRLNACLVHIRYIQFDKYDGKLSHHYNQVVDLFANKVILYGRFIRDADKNTEKIIDTMEKDIPNYTSIEYFTNKKKLFSE